jgi:hypothetical protein
MDSVERHVLAANMQAVWWHRSLASYCGAHPGASNLGADVLTLRVRHVQFEYVQTMSDVHA